VGSVVGGLWFRGGVGFGGGLLALPLFEVALGI